VASPSNKKLGEILLESGIITEVTLNRVLARSQKLSKKIGATLEELGIVTDEELAHALAKQFGCKVISDFARFSFPRELLEIISEDVAMQSLLFPLKRDGNKLAVAIADPTQMRILDNIASNHGLQVYPYVATRKDIITAIARHYLDRDPDAQRERTVLLVEDDKQVYTMIHSILTREGYRVLVKTDGMEGYKTAAAESPHVILTEKDIPKLDGYGLFDALQNNPETRSIPVILVTGSLTEKEEERVFKKGFYDYIEKPVRETTLKMRVKRAFDACSARY
jgi:CheY-like chemotaxis protein